MENLYTKLDTKERIVDLGEDFINETGQELVDIANNGLVDSIIDYYLLKKLPEFIAESIKTAKSREELDKVDFAVYLDRHDVDLPRCDSYYNNKIKAVCLKIHNIDFDEINRCSGYRNYRLYDTKCEKIFIDTELGDDLKKEFKARIDCYNNKNGISIDFYESTKAIQYCKFSISGSVKDLINLYYTELQAYEYEHDKEYDEKELGEKAKVLKMNFEI